jgi:hypothetical protein
MTHAPVSEKSHNTSLSERVERLGRYYTTMVYGMMELQILAKILPWVLKKAPLGFEEVPIPLCADIHFPDAILCSSMCTKPEGVLVFVWLILESSPLVLIIVSKVVTNFHLLGAWSFFDFLDNLPWLRSSSISPRLLLTRLSAIALKEFSSEVVILGYTIPSSDLHELNALAYQ